VSTTVTLSSQCNLTNKSSDLDLGAPAASSLVIITAAHPKCLLIVFSVFRRTQFPRLSCVDIQIERSDYSVTLIIPEPKESLPVTLASQLTRIRLQFADMSCIHDWNRLTTLFGPANQPDILNIGPL
jgi:hypothetical protein